MKKQFITAAISLGIIASGFAFANQAEAHELTYKVQQGDTLWKIATNNHLTVNQLIEYNNLSSSIIKVDQELTLLAPHSHETAPSTAVYTVKAGDSLWSIANRYKITVTELQKLNNLTTSIIKVGQVLKVPTIGTQSLNADALIYEAKKYIGVPYKWGGTTPEGFDCSGFINYVFNKQGISIPRTVATLWSASTPVSTPQKGDIVFFSTIAPGPSHAGIYIGDNKFIHASSSAGVTISDLSNSYWKSVYLGAKRIK